MSVIGDLESAAASLFAEGVKALVKHVWHEVTGDADSDDAKKAIEAIADKAKAAAIMAALTAAQTLTDNLGYRLALSDLAFAAERLLRTTTAEYIEQHRTVPKLDLDIELVPPGTLDEPPEPPSPLPDSPEPDGEG